MRIIITGGAGFIGSQLAAALLERGHGITVFDHHLPRQPVDFVDVDLGTGHIPSGPMETADAIIHLAGKNLFGRWDEKVKRQILDSRVFGTRSLVDALRSLPQRPSVLVSASAVGYYGDRGEEDLDETSSPGNDFLATVCLAWEREAHKAEELGLRTVQVRTAPVLGRGGMLGKMLPAFRLGLGGPIGSGQQWLPWVHTRDVIDVYVRAVEDESLSGPLNACAPQTVRYAEFAHTLGTVLHRPTVLPTPIWALRLAYGDLVSLLLGSQKVHPRRLQEKGYAFAFPELRPALQDALR